MLARLRGWLPVLYGASFTLVLLYLTYAASFINREMWSAVASRELWDRTSPLPFALAQAVGIVALTVVLSRLIARVDRGFQIRAIVQANLNFRPLFHPWVRWPFAALLLWNLPVLAMLEEFIFRHGLGQWPINGAADVAMRSILFGLAHVAASGNLRGGIVQAVLAFWFSYQYLIGVDAWHHASMAHFLVDAVALTPVVIGILLGFGRTRPVPA
jgi:hypothetical protein